MSEGLRKAVGRFSQPAPPNHAVLQAKWYEAGFPVEHHPQEPKQARGQDTLELFTLTALVWYADLQLRISVEGNCLGIPRYTNQFLPAGTRSFSATRGVQKDPGRSTTLNSRQFSYLVLHSWELSPCVPLGPTPSSFNATEPRVIPSVPKAQP